MRNVKPKAATVILVDEQIRFCDDCTGPCRQLTLYEHDPACGCCSPGTPAKALR